MENFRHSPNENILSIARIQTFIICFIQHLNKIRTISPAVNTAKVLFTSLRVRFVLGILTRDEYTAVVLFYAVIVH